MVEGRRRELVRQAFFLEYVTLAWMVIEAAVAIGAGLAARSITLLAFGIDSVIELTSATVLIWRGSPSSYSTVNPSENPPSAWQDGSALHCCLRLLPMLWRPPDGAF